MVGGATVAALGLEGFWSGVVYGGVYGFTRGFLTGSLYIWYKGESFEDGLNAGLWLGGYLGLKDAVTYGGIAGLGESLTVWEIMLLNNLDDNIDIFHGDKLRLHLGIVGYDFGETVAYWIGNKDISWHHRFDMAYETVGFLSLYPDGKKYFCRSQHSRVPQRNTFLSQCKIGGNRVEIPNYRYLFNYYYQDEINNFYNFLYPAWSSDWYSEYINY